jgi:hypothetical protein
MKPLTAALALTLGSLPISAKVLLTEHFDYPAGNLYQQGLWTKFGSQTANPIQVVDGSLTFAGYQATAVGGRLQSANLVNSSEQDLHRPFDNGETLLSGSLYLGALVNIKDTPHADEADTYQSQFILCLDAPTKTAAIADGKSTSNYWRLFVRESKNSGKFTFGLGKNSAAEKVYTPTEYDLGKTYLVVVKYEFVDGAANDILSLYINEAGAAEPESPAISTNSGLDVTTTANGGTSDLGIGGVAVMQNGTSAKAGVAFDLDALKAATTWGELFESAGGTTEPDTPQNQDPAITAGTLAPFGSTTVGTPLTQSINVRATALKGDITVGTPSDAAFSVGAASISKAAAEAAKGYDLTVTFNPASAGDYSGSFTLTSEGAAPVTIALSGSATEKTPDPTFAVTRTYLYAGKPLAINTTTVVARYRVEAGYLTKAAGITLSGTNRTLFSLSTDSIASGTSTTEVVVSYTPTAVGKHTGRINFDVTPAALATGEGFTFYAYDPANPPSIHYLPTELDIFRAQPGETASQTLTVTTANLPDYGSAKLAATSGGAFTITNTTLLKKGESVINIKFTPSAAGVYSDELRLAAVGADTVTIALKGECTGKTPLEEREGDALYLSTDYPLTLLNESFGSTTKNQVISLERWHNIAIEGTRAWWGYEFDDANKAAKVTAYDSKYASGAGAACQMTLVTPPLDFVNSASKLLTFRVMGQNLLSTQTDKLEVCYIDIADGGNVFIQPLTGVDIPASDDYNDTWQNFVVDFEGQQLADAFFVGFRFTSTRGRDNSAVYYVDDVTYGRTDVPQIKFEDTDNRLDMTALPGTDTPLLVGVVGKNLTENITVSLAGDDKDNFTLKTTSLPSYGGFAEISFNGSDERDYYAYLTLTCDGAPNAYYPMYVTVKKEDIGTAISRIKADDTGRYTVYSLTGVRVLSTADASELAKLPQGIYLVNGQKFVAR